MLDRYKNYAELAWQEMEGEHYRVRVADRASPVAIVAPHGGMIETGTSELAAAIARHDFSFYCFEGLQPDRPHSDLHITSSHFDEPRALSLVEACDIAITVHGRRDHGDDRTVWLGGLDTELGERMGITLERIGVGVRTTDHHLKGNGPNNICNRGRRKRGVQLELPQSIRDGCVASPSRLREFSDAIRHALQLHV